MYRVEVTSAESFIRAITTVRSGAREPAICEVGAATFWALSCNPYSHFPAVGKIGMQDRQALLRDLFMSEGDKQVELTVGLQVS